MSALMSGRGSRIRISLRARAAQEIAILQTTYNIMNILRPLSPRLRGRVFSLLIFFGVLGFSSVFLQLLGINLDMLLGPLFHRILVHLVVSRFGWYSGGFLLAMVFVGLDLENKMMMGENCDKEVTSSSSWNWRKCLNLSSDTEENKTPGPQAPPLPIESGTVAPANAVAFSEAGPSQVAPPAPANRPPEERTSSTWSGSWIGRWFNQEVYSSAVNEGGHEATSQPIEVMEPAEAPTMDDLRSKIKLVVRGRRRLRSDVLQRVEEDLSLETASPQKRIKIDEVLDYISKNRDSLLNSRQSLIHELTVKVNDWEREQRHFPNPVDDVP